MLGGAGFWSGISSLFSHTFKYVQTDLGTTPTATSSTDTLTLTSSDNSLEITGDSSSKTIDFKVLSVGANLTEIQEEPSGTRDGSNVTFTLSQTPNNVASLKLYLNGVFQRQGAGGQYTISGATITMASPPAANQELDATYFY